MGIEPTCEAWKASVLPLNYTRTETNTNVDALLVNQACGGARRQQVQRCWASTLPIGDGALAGLAVSRYSADT